MRIRDVMDTDLTTVREDVPLELALELMRWHGLRHVPVLHDGRLVGVLTDRDLARALAAGDLGGSVASAMEREVRTAPPELEVTQAATILASDPIGCLAVLEGERLIGMVTPTDLLRTVPRRSPPPAPADAWRP